MRYVWGSRVASGRWSDKEFFDVSTIILFNHPPLTYRLKHGPLFGQWCSTDVPIIGGQALGKSILADDRPMSVRTLKNNRSISYNRSMYDQCTCMTNIIDIVRTIWDATWDLGLRPSHGDLVRSISPIAGHRPAMVTEAIGVLHVLYFCVIYRFLTISIQSSKKDDRLYTYGNWIMKQYYHLFQ